MNDDLKAKELPAGAGSPCGGARLGLVVERCATVNTWAVAEVRK